jgi:hypothetical protein
MNKLLRKFVREVLVEKRFADLGVSKGKWTNIPSEELAVHTPEIDLDDEVFDLITTAYAGLAGGNLKVKSPNDLPGKYTFFDVIDLDDDPEPDSVVFGKIRGGNLKIGGMGHDGSSGKSVSISRLIELVKQPGTFAEVSGRPAEILLSAGVPVVTDYEKAKALVQRDIQWYGKHPTKDYGPGIDGWYSRSYGDATPHLKIIVGNV